VTRTASPFLTVTADWYSEDTRPVGGVQVQNWSRFDDPQVDQLFTQAAQALNPVTGSAAYSQIDDQLWDQMVALPLFAVPTLVTNGVQIQNVEFNPTPDGILWNAADWTLLKPAPKTTSN
jgi:peptide/nickel transport system substrate-binding protein